MTYTLSTFKPFYRPRRNRKIHAIRKLVQETQLTVQDLIYPVFLTEGERVKESIRSLPGIFRFSLDELLKEVEEIVDLGILALAIFPVIPKEKKDLKGQIALKRDGILQLGLATIKKEFPDLCLITDVALDPYTIHGHDGIVNETGEILNDETVEILMEMALIQAEVGVDMVAPSDMMDGRVRAIREALDANGFTNVGIHAYTAKYASCFYAPFRDALSSKLQFGNKKTYQMNPANRKEALLEMKLDLEEGADVLMVKPALPYLDVLCKLKEESLMPLSAYQVSGEYAMIAAAAQNGWLDGPSAFFESILCIKRAGADMIFTYAAPLVARMIKNGVLD